MAEEKHFDLVASTYGARARKGLWGWLKTKEMLAVLNEVKSTVRNLNRTAMLLDVGCGTGLYAELLNREVSKIEILGVDKSEAMIQEFQKLGFKGYRLDAEKEPIPEGEFDIILLLGTLEFMKDLSMLQLSLKKSIRLEGQVLVLFPALSFLNLNYYAYHLWHGNRIYLRADKLYRKLFQNAGFEITKDFKVTPVSRLMVLQRTHGNRNL